MTLLIEQPASVAAIERIDINIDECKKPHVLPGRWSSSSRAGWSSAGQPGLPEMLAVENAALHEFFEYGRVRDLTLKCVLGHVS